MGICLHSLQDWEQPDCSDICIRECGRRAWATWFLAGRRESGIARVIDLNVATEEQLQELAGIGPALSARDRGEPSISRKLELVSRMVIPEAVYQRIKDKIGVSDEATDAPIEVAFDRRRSSMRIAAIGDLHFSPQRYDPLRETLSHVRDNADVLVLAGDLTNYGTPEEMESLLNALVRSACRPLQCSEP